MNIEKPSFKKICLMHLQALTNFPYIEKDFDAITDYELLCKVVDYLNQVITNTNEQNTVVENLYNAFVELKDYVDNYFDNLDVQEEIDHKLDEMAESGELTDIIAQYLGLAGMITFNNVTEMKNATNLVSGSKCMTLGYYEVNDGGNSIYKIRNITNDDIVDEMTIIKLNNNNLIAELIHDNCINTSQMGIKEDTLPNITSSKIQSIIEKYKNGLTLIINPISINTNTIIINETINNLKIEGSNYKLSRIIFNGENEDYIFKFNYAVSNLNINNLIIDGDNNGNGIYFSNNKSGYIDINNTFFTKVHKGIYCGNVVYFNIVNSYFGLTINAIDDDYAIKLNGYEYNYITNCHFQCNTQNNHPNVNLLIIDNTSYTYVNNCEFAKTSGKAIYITSTSSHSNYLYLTNNVLYGVSNGITCDPKNTSNNNIYIINTNIHLLGLTNTESAIHFLTSNTKKTGNIIIDNIIINRIGSTSPTNAIIFENDSVFNVSINNYSLTFSTNILIAFNNNEINNFSSLLNQTTKTMINSDGSQTEFILHFVAGRLPYSTINLPFIICSLEETLKDYAFKTSSTYVDNSNRLSIKIVFDSPIPAGNYDVFMKAIY